MECYEPGETIPAPLPRPREPDRTPPNRGLGSLAGGTVIIGPGATINVAAGGVVLVNPTVLVGAAGQGERAGMPLHAAAVGGAAGAPPAGGAADPDWYAACLARAAAVQRRNWQAATNTARDKAWSELDEWSRARLGKPAEICSPNDLTVYLGGYWLGAHGRQLLPNGARAPAPSTLETTLAHLSTRFTELGKRGDWDPDTGRGNPCRSYELRTFKGGYANAMQEVGFHQRSVPPLPEWKMERLLAALEAEAAAVQGAGDRPWHVEALLRRDAAVLGLLWESYRRPAEVGRLAVEAVSAGSGELRGQAASSKMCHASRGARLPRPIEVRGAAGERLCGLLGAYQECLGRHGQHLGAYLFSPLQRDGRALDGTRGLSAAAMTKRVVEHLRRLKLYEGETVYSLKRGAMQHAFFVQGQPLQAIGEAADIDTPAVVQLYLDPMRHL